MLVMHIGAHPSPSLRVYFLHEAAQTAVKGRNADEHKEKHDGQACAMPQYLLYVLVNCCMVMRFCFHNFAITITKH
jgi:hypothetical protein